MNMRTKPPIFPAAITVAAEQSKHMHFPKQQKIRIGSFVTFHYIAPEGTPLTTGGVYRVLDMEGTYILTTSDDDRTLVSFARKHATIFTPAYLH